MGDQELFLSCAFMTCDYIIFGTSEEKVMDTMFIHISVKFTQRNYLAYQKSKEECNIGAI